MTHNDNRPGPGQNSGETAIFTFCRKAVFWPNICFFPEKQPNTDIYLGKGYSFLCTTLSGLWGFGPKKFCDMAQDFVNGPFVALGNMVDLPNSDRFFDFLFPNYGHFRKKKQLKRQKVFPHLRLPVTALALSARRPFGPVHARSG